MSKQIGEPAIKRLFRFAESQRNIDWVATRLFAVVVVLGVPLAIATIAAIVTK